MVYKIDFKIKLFLALTLVLLLTIPKGFAQFDFNSIRLSVGTGSSGVLLNTVGQFQTSASTIESIKGNGSWFINCTTSLFKSASSSLHIGGYFSKHSYKQDITNIRTLDGTFDVTAEVYKTDVGIPFLYGLDIGKERKVGVFLIAGIVPLRSFYSLENISGSNELANIDPVFLSGKSIKVRKINLNALLAPSIRISILPNVAMTIGPEVSVKLLADETYLQRTLARDVLYGGSIGLILNIEKS